MTTAALIFLGGTLLGLVLLTLRQAKVIANLTNRILEFELKRRMAAMDIEQPVSPETTLTLVPRN